MADTSKPTSDLESVDITIIRFSDIIDNFEEDKVQDLLESFECSKNSDVQYFLHKTARLIEETNKGRTYLVVTTSSYENLNSPLEIVGYFTLALKYFEFKPDVSNTLKKKLNGLSSEVDGVACYLIGQLGRNDNTSARVAGSVLLDLALDRIQEAKDVVGGRFVLVECEQNLKLISFYEINNFIRIPDDSDDSMAQLFCLLSRTGDDKQ